MNARDQLPNDEIMRMLTKIAVETAAAQFAQHARDFATLCPDGVTGRDALLSFATAIEANNARMNPKTGRSS